MTHWNNIGPGRWSLKEGDLEIIVTGDFVNHGWKMLCPAVGWSSGIDAVPLKAADAEAARVEALAEVTKRITSLAMQSLELNGKLQTPASQVSTRSKPGGPIDHKTAHAFASIAAAGALELERQKSGDLAAAVGKVVELMPESNGYRSQLVKALEA